MDVELFLALLLLILDHYIGAPLRVFYVVFKQPGSEKDVFVAQLSPESWTLVASALLLLQLVMAVVSVPQRTTAATWEKKSEGQHFGVLDMIA